MAVFVLKALYSVVLIGVAAILFREALSVWLDRQVYVGTFEVTSGAGKDAEASVDFSKRVVGAQAVLGGQLEEYSTRSTASGGSDNTYTLPGSATLLLPAKALEGIDITIQSVNLTQVLTAIRKGFRAPNEVHGHVTMRESSAIAAVDWPRAPAPANKGTKVTRFLTPSLPGAHEAAAYVACLLSYVRAAGVDKEFAAIPRGQFCDFAFGLGDFYALSTKASQPNGLSEAEATLVRARAAQLRTHYESLNILPEIYRLHADLLDLLPEKTRTQAELVEAQEDRLRYATLSSEVNKLPEETKRLAALALARPAIVLENGKPVNVLENWSGLLTRYGETIRAASAATGLVVSGDGQPVGTGFLIGKDLVATMDFVLDGVPKPTLCMGPSANKCQSVLSLGKRVYEDKESHIVIIEASGHDVLEHPPLVVTSPLPEANTLSGRYAFVIGYSFQDSVRLPEAFVQRLLGGKEGVQRVIPGRILALNADNVMGSLSFVTDISTTSGTAGGPLIDLATGALLGVNWGGLWQGERGKFAYANPFPKDVMDCINKARRPASVEQLQGKPIPQQSSSVTDTAQPGESVVKTKP